MVIGEGCDQAALVGPPRVVQRCYKSLVHNRASHLLKVKAYVQSNVQCLRFAINA